MATLADYLVLSDGAFDIGSAPVSFSFDLPADFVVGTNLAKPVLQYIWRPLSDDGNFRIWVNPPPGLLPPSVGDPNGPVVFHTWGDEQGRDYGLWEAIPGGRFNVGANTLHFDGSRNRFRGVILWFQRRAFQPGLSG